MSTQTEVKTDPIREVFDELFTLLETLETNNTAVLQFLQDQGINGEKLAPYLERAGNASNVKMRAARKRMEYLLTPIQKETAPSNKEQEKEKEKREAKPEDGAKAKNNEDKNKEDKSKAEKDNEAEKRSAESAQLEGPSEKPRADNPAANKNADTSADTTENTARPQERPLQ